MKSLVLIWIGSQFSPLGQHIIEQKEHRLAGDVHYQGYQCGLGDAPSSGQGEGCSGS